jgi:hypothetical protein
LAPGPAVAPPGAWVISSSQLTTMEGRASSSETAGPCGPRAGSQACNDYIESLHLRQTVTYQPASRPQHSKTLRDPTRSRGAGQRAFLGTLPRLPGTCRAVSAGLAGTRRPCRRTQRASSPLPQR